MAESSRTRYEIDLPARVVAPATARSVAAPRLVTPGDAAALAELMLDAYRGTIDSEDETLDDAVAEIGQWLAGAPLVEHSRCVVVDGVMAAAVLLSLVGGDPFVAYVMTRAEYKGKGLARALVDDALGGLERAGNQRVAMVITDGNIPSERLFASVGARPVPVDRAR